MKKVILFIILVSLLFACGSKSDQDYYNAAKAKIEEGSYPEAIEEFETLLEEYPASELEAEVLFEVGKLYHGKVVKNLTDEESLSRAIEYYQKVHTKYPEHNEAPNSFFMIGFIQANELQQLGAAEETYKAFLEKYPDHEMAVSAKAEIDNLGLEPEEILRKKMAAETGEK